jgi:hypothetical protein
MFVLITGRRHGKTQAIISWLMEDPEWRGVIVADHRRAEEIMARIRRTPLAYLGKKYWDQRVISVGRFPMDLRGRGFREVALEDFEHLFEAMYGVKVGFMAATGTVIAPDMPDTDGIVDGEEVWEDEPLELESVRQKRLDPTGEWYKSDPFTGLNPAGPDRFA